MNDVFMKRMRYNLNFAFAFIIILSVLYFTPGVESDSDTYNMIFKQINFNTRHFEFYKLFFYLLSVSMGFILINQITTGVEIVKRYLFGFGGAFGDFFIVMGYSLIIFFFSGNTVITGLYDYESFCDQKGLSVIESHKKDGDIGNFLFVFMIDVKRLYSFRFLENFFNFFQFVDLNTNNICVFPKFFEIMFLNYYFYIFPFLFGLNFFCIIENFQIIKYLEINWNKSKNWNMKHWIVYIALIIFFVLNVVFHFVNYARDSIWKFGFFFILFFLIASYISYRYVKNKKTKVLDVSSPTLIMLVLIFVNIHCVYDLILFGFLSGILAAGAGEKGVGDMFKEIDLDNYKNFNFVPNHVEIDKKDTEYLDK